MEWGLCQKFVTASRALFFDEAPELFVLMEKFGVFGVGRWGRVESLLRVRAEVCEIFAGFFLFEILTTGVCNFCSVGPWCG